MSIDDVNRTLGRIEQSLEDGNRERSRLFKKVEAIDEKLTSHISDEMSHIATAEAQIKEIMTMFIIVKRWSFRLLILLAFGGISSGGLAAGIIPFDLLKVFGL